MKKSLIKKIAAILAVTVALGLTGLATIADENGAIKASVSDAQMAEEIAAANTVMDVYCLATWDGSKGEYVLTDAYSALADVMTDVKELTGEEAQAAGRQAGQKALELTFASGSSAVPVNPESLNPDQTVDRLQAGWYMVLLHGSDLTADEYYKTVSTEDGDVHMTISQSEDTEYRFSPVLLTVSDRGEAAEFEAKVEAVPRFGSLRITKSVDNYHASEPVTFVFRVTGRDDAGNIKYDNYTGLTFPAQKEVALERLYADLTYTVSEIYTGSNMVQVSADPAPVKIVAGSQSTVDLDAEGSIVSVSFTNNYDHEEKEGNGIVNSFKYNGKQWIWYKDGVIQEQ